MPTVRVPLVGSFNQRGIDGEAALNLNEDQRFLNCEFETVTNPVTNKSVVYVKKRAGWNPDSLVNPYALSLPGTANNYLSTPDSSALDIVGDIDIRVLVALDDWTPSTGMTFIGKFETANQHSYTFNINTNGTLAISWTEDGSTAKTASSSVAPTIADGQAIWIRVTLDVDNGSSGYTANFYTAPVSITNPFVWTMLGTPQNNTPTTSIFSGTSVVEIGSAIGGSIFNIAGKIVTAIIYSGIDGTQKAVFQASDYTPAGTTLTSSVTGEVYTLHGTAAINTSNTISIGTPSTALIHPQSFNATLAAFGETNSAVYLGTYNVGNITGRALHLTENIVSAATHIDIKSSDGTGWYYVDGAKDVTTYTVRISTSSFILTSVSSTAGVYSGQLVTGNGIGAGARVTSVNSAASTIGLNVTSATASTSSISIYKEPVAKILDTNFVSTGVYRSAFVPMDGYLFYATDDGTLRNSDLNTDIVYSANSNIAVQMSPDPTVAVATQKNTVIAFGLNSKEVFYNAGLASGSPLQRSPQFFDRIGCLDQRSVTQIENDIYFVSTPYEGDVGVYRIRDLQALKISTPVVDRIMGTVAGTGSIYANSFRYGGYPYAGFVLSTSADAAASFRLIEGSSDRRLTESGDFRTIEDSSQTGSFVRFLVYNIQLNIWSEWDCNQCTFIDSIGSGTNNQLIATSRMNNSGKVYRIDPVSDGAVFTDDGIGYTAEIRTAKLDLGSTDKKYIREINLIADTLSSSSQTVATLYYSDDDYGTWKGGQVFDLTNQKKNVHRLGAHFHGRAYKLTVSGGPFRAEALEIRYDKGIS